MLYNKFQYLYPPRPEVKTNPESIDMYDNKEYIAQPKYNGSCCIVFTNGIDLHVFNRHKMQLVNLDSRNVDFKQLAKSRSWYVYAGEYLNKGKIGETGEKEKDKYVIWDCLVWDGEYLIGATLEERLSLLENIYPCQRAKVSNSGLEIYDHLCCTEFKGIYKSPTYLNGFQVLYNDVIKTDLYEGIVLKKLHSKLTWGFNERNNHEWQIKIRKPTKLYNF